ncbi:MAG: acetylglutamate kinase [Myxococcales bacterium]|nr:acetylglutamate kinase [Myxococcales bacterium]
MNLVVKLGGEVVGDGRLAAIAVDLAALAAAGHRVTVVHGGGPQATDLQRRLGIEPRIVGGRRVTDGPTLDVMKMVIAGRLNVDLCAALRAASARPLGLHGAIFATRRPPRVVSGAGPDPVDLGLVGDVTGFDLALLATAHGAGYLPVLACLGTAPDGAVFNINADVVANRLAVAEGADLLVLVSSVDGVRRVVTDPASRIARLTAAEGRRAITDGTVTGGMIPKLEESFAALAEGVRQILIVAGDLARAVGEPGSAGTLLDG